ncbi:MAG: ester cyclase [Oleispira antarctica]|uniref:Ester cyclase n=1 Tax=Oleispira antarctica RB-8 TaxID=698738 RepID=R4YUV3_OLEAN|nr:ester cyclase [Oleispira antarctica]MBQ0794269.1 ester cyclase [Oleispira antarctica]CCK77099.1 conserved hypothetical protein [Oleispira antarctica RB-8]|tara:strand:+ start:549 stop:953 length:405 start_codon:yes stop_codon:yes gene_type:complete
MTSVNKSLVEKHIDLSWNKGKYGLLQQIVAKGFRYQTTFKDGFRDFEGYVEYVEDIRRAVPDLEVIVEEIMSEDDKVITFSTFCGSFNKPLFGMPANGKIIAFSAASVWIIHRGKIKEQTTMVDLAGLQKQLNA